jgi:hypothetical protein
MDSEQYKEADYEAADTLGILSILALYLIKFPLSNKADYNDQTKKAPSPEVNRYNE